MNEIGQFNIGSSHIQNHDIIHTIVSKLALEFRVSKHVLDNDRSAVDNYPGINVDGGLSPTVTVSVQHAPGVRSLCE